MGARFVCGLPAVKFLGFISFVLSVLIFEVVRLRFRLELGHLWYKSSYMGQILGLLSMWWTARFLFGAYTSEDTSELRDLEICLISSSNSSSTMVVYSERRQFFGKSWYIYFLAQNLLFWKLLQTDLFSELQISSDHLYGYLWIFNYMGQQYRCVLREQYQNFLFWVEIGQFISEVSSLLESSYHLIPVVLVA